MEHPKKLTQRQTMNYGYMVDAMKRFEWDMHHAIMMEGRVPHAWEDVWETRRPGRTRVTLRLDDDVLKFFRAMGGQYGPKVNDVLRIFMHAQLAGFFEGHETPEALLPAKIPPEKKPEWKPLQAYVEKAEEFQKLQEG